ncbi:MAG: hypothetical protein ACFFCS_01470 [Candidatus Hodarchaeota archaeon]
MESSASFQDLLDETTIINLALQRDPSLITRVLHELKNSTKMFPSLMEFKEINSNENVVAVKNISPKILDYHLHGLIAIKNVIKSIKSVIPWAYFYYTNVMLSLYRGFFPKIFSPNAFYLYLMSSTESELFKSINSPGFQESVFEKQVLMINDFKEMVTGIWELKFYECNVKFGPVGPQDFLVSASYFDNSIIIHPIAPFSQFWPSIFIYKLAKLLLHQHYPKMSERFKEQLSLLTIRATIGEALQVPGMYYDTLNEHPVDHAQYQVTKISRDLKDYGDFNHKFLHLFEPRSFEDNYSLDMISSLIVFLIEENQVDELDLFARISASNAGYKSFNDNFMLFQNALKKLEKLEFLKIDEINNKICLIE